MNIANFVTSIRLLALVPLLWTIALGDKNGAWICLFWYLFAGGTDILDGFLARKLELVSKFGAMLDLLADRLLTLSVFIGLLYRGNGEVLVLIISLILIGRDFFVAGLNEIYPNQLDIKVTNIEKTKVALQFIGLGILLAPNFVIFGSANQSHGMGLVILSASAAICAYTIFVYALKAKSLPNDK